MKFVKKRNEILIKKENKFQRRKLYKRFVKISFINNKIIKLNEWWFIYENILYSNNWNFENKNKILKLM